MSLETDPVTWVQVVDVTVCDLHNVNTLGKGVNPTILPTAVGKS